MNYANTYLHIGQDDLHLCSSKRETHMTKLTKDQAAALAFEYGKARDSKAFARLVMRVSVKSMKYSELFSHYAAGMKA